ncbi:MAG: Gfo/Idh/MocA family protein [Planctomycetota bacterium]
MAETLRIGVLGLVHDHIWGNLDHIEKLDDLELVAAADPHQELLEAFNDKTGVGTYTDYEQLLDREELDAVLAYGTNRSTGALVEMAAGRGLDVMIEKPMASGLDVADRMLVACRQAGVTFMVNWPTAWSPGFNHAHELVEEGTIGRVWQMKWRGGHCGPDELGCDEHFVEWLFDPVENGAGAMFDYLGYGASLARWFIGQPSQVMAIAGRLVRENIPVDDNAVVALEYERANAVIETTWTEAVPGWPSHDLILYGTEGVMIAGRDEVNVVTVDNREGRTHKPPELKSPRRNGPEYFAHCIRTGEPIEGMCSPGNAHDAQEVMEAARLSVLTGQRVALPLVDHLYAL